MSRSTKPDIRNPLLGLPSVIALQDLSPEARAALKEMLRNISKDCRVRANKAWASHKAPMAAYWKSLAVYANHMQRLL